MQDFKGKFFLVKVDLGDQIVVLVLILAFVVNRWRLQDLSLFRGFLECLPDVASKFLALEHNILAVLFVKTFDSNS